MKRRSVSRRPISRLSWRMLSVPLFFKIMGIGILVAAVFGGITLLQIRGSVSRTLHQMLEEETRSMARSLVASLERPMSTGDLFTVHQKIRRTLQMFPDIRYIIIRDPKGHIVSHTFEKAVPADLVPLVRVSDGFEEEVQVLSTEEGLVFDVTCPILNGHAGMLQLGATDRTITVELEAITRSLFWSLALCATIGAGLALLLTHILTRPIYHLVEAANRIREGDFATRSRVFSGDEIGRLALAFNQMAESLERYRQEVQDKEKARLSLIEKIVHTQEEERKIISRELHDQFGQSLLALLLAVQSLYKDNDLYKEGRLPRGTCDDIEDRIRKLIDDVGRLAWGMRPSILDDYGLDSAVARHVQDISEHSDLDVDYQYSCPPGLERLPNQIEVTLYRITQEAFTNILRHAHATRASAVVLQRRDEVTLLVEDDGCGFDPAEVENSRNGCLGLMGMKERVALLGGTCAVESAPGQGTTIRVRIPLEVK